MFLQSVGEDGTRHCVFSSSIPDRPLSILRGSLPPNQGKWSVYSHNHSRAVYPIAPLLGGLRVPFRGGGEAQAICQGKVYRGLQLELRPTIALVFLGEAQKSQRLLSSLVHPFPHVPRPKQLGWSWT